MGVEKLTLPAARKMANLSQKQLADACGVSESTVAKWEKFTSEPRLSQAIKAGEACGVNHTDIIFLPEDTVKP